MNWWFNYFSVPGPAYLPNIGATITGYDIAVPEVNGAGSVLFKVNPTTMKVYRWCDPAWPNCLMPYTGEFSYVTPGLLYYASGTQVMTYNYDTSTGPSLVWRFMHNRADGLATPTSQPDTNYNALAMPSCSKDGKICIFATDWQQALGSYQGKARVDVFAIRTK